MLMLDIKGIVAAFIIGVIVYIFGGAEKLFLLIAFLAFSIFVTRYDYYNKKEMGVYDYERGWKNVLSNGFFPTVFAVLSPVLGPYPFISSVAAITADKFSSELGIFGGNPYDVFTLKKVKPGTSGAVSALGFLASFAGASLTALTAMAIFSLSSVVALKLAFFGFIGCFADSVAGAFEERGFGTKETSNLAGAFVGGLLGVLV
ncbi:MAG: DUF92 domain-containing protein [Candidatus Anstonellales archaeon]